MKPSFLFYLNVCITALSVFVSSQAQAQNKEMAHSSMASIVVSEKVNGNALIEKMIAQRRAFNKSHENALLSAPEYIFCRKHLTTISFNGVDYLVENDKVVGLKGIKLSPEILEQITEKLVFLDKVQYDYAQKFIAVYNNTDTETDNVKSLDRSYLLSLRILNTTLSDISSFVKRSNPVSTVALNLAKMPLPNIDIIERNQNLLPLVQLSKK